MPDFLKKAAKQLAKVSAENEEARAALFVRPRVAGATRRLGAPGGTLGKLGASDGGASSDAPDTVDAQAAPDPSDSSGLLDHNAVLVLTDRRLLVFEHGSLLGRVKGLTAEVPLDHIADMELDVPDTPAEGPASLEISFTDGSSTVVTPGSRRKHFIAAFERSRHPA